MTDSERNDASRDQIERLLRTTGRRPTAPADRAERVKAAVRTHWRNEVDRQSRGRGVRTWAALAVAATVIAAVGLGLWQFLGTATVPAVAGRVEVAVSPGVWLAGDEVRAGSELDTAAGRLAVRMGSGHSVRLDTGTRVRVLSESEIALDRGRIYIDSHGPLGLSAREMEIRTPFGRLRDIGTQFEARLLDASLRVRVREGVVVLDGAGTPHEVEAGQELEVDRDGRADRRDLTVSGTEWAWIAEVTPMMDIEGRRLAEFLEWMARESGLRLRFDSTEAAHAASRITLDGSVAGMTLDEALDSILATSRMSHRVEGDDLVIESLSDA